MKRYIQMVAGVGTIIVATMGLFLGIGFFVLNGLMYIFGGSYEHVGIAFLFLGASLILGLLLDFVVGLFTDVIAMADPPGLLEMLVMIDLFFAWLPLYFLDEWMQTITLPTAVELGGALVLTLVSLPSICQQPPLKY